MKVRSLLAALAILLSHPYAMAQERFALGPGMPGETPKERLTAAAEIGAYLQFHAAQIRTIYELMGGVVDCPVFPEPWDFVFPAPGTHLDGWTVTLVRPGTDTPCAAFAAVPPGPKRGGSLLRMREAVPLDETELTRLRMVRAAREEVDRALGRGRHMYVLVPGDTPDRSLIYAWSEVYQTPAPATDFVRIGAAAIVYVGGGIGTYVARRVYLSHLSPLAWDVHGSYPKQALGLRSAQDTGQEALSAFDVLRALANPHLCPRLLKSPDGAIVVESDGSWRALEGAELDRLSTPPAALLPGAQEPAREVMEYKARSKRLARPEPAGTTPQQGLPQEAPQPVLPGTKLPDPPVTRYS